MSRDLRIENCELRNAPLSGAVEPETRPLVATNSKFSILNSVSAMNDLQFASRQLLNVANRVR